MQECLIGLIKTFIWISRERANQKQPSWKRNARHCSRLDAKRDEFRLQLGINDSCANCIVSILTISTGVALGAPIPNEPVAS
jgi:hypothetical protein